MRGFEGFLIGIVAVVCVEDGGRTGDGEVDEIGGVGDHDSVDVDDGGGEEVDGFGVWGERGVLGGEDELGGLAGGA